ESVTVLVNPDVELVDGSLVKLAEELRRSDRILAPAVLLPDGSRQDSAQARAVGQRSEEHTSELQSQSKLVCRLLLEKKKRYLYLRKRRAFLRRAFAVIPAG